MDWQVLRAAATRCGVERVVAVDVGARGGVGDRWSGLGDLVQVIGFDPDEAECARLAKTAPKNVRYVPVALAESDRSAPLNATADPACSSLYPPIPSVSARLPASACTRPTGTSTVRVRSFDSWREETGAPPPDVMKLDVQGSELLVLRGAARSLASVQLLEVEVEFNPIYEGQPLYGDVDRFLRESGFVLWRLSNPVHYSNGDPRELGMRMPEIAHFDSRPIRSERGGGQLYWAHAHYVRRELAPASADTIDASQGLRAAAVAAAYGLFDLAHAAIGKIDRGLDRREAEGLGEALRAAADPRPPWRRLWRRGRG